MSGLLVSVIVPHYNDLEALETCLSALAAQTFPPEKYEIIVADNASPCGPDAVRAVINGRARFVEVKAKGAGPARNGGVQAASAPILAFTDSDCVPSAEWLAAGVSSLNGYDIVGGQVVVLSADPMMMTATEAFEAVFAFDFEKYILRDGFTGSGNLFVPRSIFDDVGGFLVGVSEDKEWSFRATGKGYRIGYEPRAVVAHPARKSWAELRTKWQRIQSESFALAKRESTGRLRWILRTWAMPLSIIPHAWKLFRSPKLHSVRDRSGAFGILARQRLWRFLDGHALLFGFRK